MAKIYSEAERKRYCEKWRASGINKIRFCRENKIGESALRKWLKLYEPNLIDPKGPKIKFLELEPIGQNEFTKVEIQLPNGLLIKAEVRSIRKLIQELSL